MRPFGLQLLGCFTASNCAGNSISNDKCEPLLHSVKSVDHSPNITHRLLSSTLLFPGSIYTFIQAERPWCLSKKWKIDFFEGIAHALVQELAIPSKLNSGTTGDRKMKKVEGQRFQEKCWMSLPKLLKGRLREGESSNFGPRWQEREFPPSLHFRYWVSSSFYTTPQIGRCGGSTRTLALLAHFGIGIGRLLLVLFHCVILLRSLSWQMLLKGK